MTDPIESAVPEDAQEPAATRPRKTTKGTHYGQISAGNWAKIEALWESGEATYADLVKTYGRSVSTFERHFRTKKIIKGSKKDEMKARVEQELEKTAVDEATVMAARIRETKEDHYKMASALARLTWNEVLQTKKDGKPMAAALNNLKALDSAMNVLKKAREERYSVLGLDRADSVDPDQVPELVISELTAEQVKLLRDRDHTELDGSTTNQDPVLGSPDNDLVTEGDED
jgi:hypothetical protein